MAVVTKYRIPFVSVDGISYRIDILAQYDGSQPASWPIALQPGETPITISEDDSDDIFTRIRPSTGSISICTQLPNGQMLNLDDIQPANNIQSPVLLQRQSGQSWITDWQGFLSCESYNQEYTGQPQNIDLPIISVLEALDAVKFGYSVAEHRQIRYILSNIIGSLESKSPLQSPFDYIYIDAESWKFLYKYIDCATLVEVKEQSNENRNTYELMGKSCKTILEDICKFIGWTAREKGASLYFEAPMPKYGMKRCTAEDLLKSDASFQSSLVQIAQSDKDMSTFSWRGDGHQMSITQGAKSVEVVANMDKYELDADIPQEMPASLIQSSSMTVVVDRENNKTASAYVSKSQNFNSKYTFQILHSTEDGERPVIEIAGTVNQLFYNTALGSKISTQTGYHYYTGAMMAQFKNANDKYESTGLYVAAVTPAAYESLIDDEYFAVKCRSLMPLNVSSGKIKIKIDAYTLTESSVQGNNNLYLETLKVKKDADEEAGTAAVVGDKITVAIQWGTKWLQSNKTWGSRFAKVQLEKTNDDIEIPVTSYNSGEIIIYVLPLPIIRTSPRSKRILEYVLRSVQVSYEPKEIIGEERSANHYFKDLNKDFNDEQSIDLSYASMLNNVLSPSHIMDSNTTPMQEVEYYDGQEYRGDRPELVLRNKMKEFYEYKRRIMELEIEKQTSMPAYSLMRVIGENNRVFRPVAESVDFQTRKATLKCIEIPSN